MDVTLAFLMIDMSLLLWLAASAYFYLNRTRQPWNSPKCLGLAVITGAALGRALAYVWPGDNAWLVPWLVLVLHGGFAVFVGALALGKLHELLRTNPPTSKFQKHVLELAAKASTAEEFAHVRVAACAALIQDGDRRLDGASLKGTIDRRFHRTV